MKPIVMRTTAKRILATVSVLLGAGCGGCADGQADPDRVLLPANAATDIRSTVDMRESDDTDVSLPPGSRVSYPLFEGDYFSVTLPASSSEGIGQRAAESAVKEIVSHMGFAADPKDRTLADEFLAKPYEMRIGGGDILGVARINCETGQQAAAGNPTSFCGLDERQQRQQIERATGMPADDYLDRQLTRYYFFQRPQHQGWPGRSASTEKACSYYRGSKSDCLNAVIEHSAIAATLRSDDTVASVTGRVFSKYRITNKPKLAAEKAVAVAYEQLWKVTGISRYEDQPVTERELPLVLLPYEHTQRFDLGRLLSLRWPGYRTPQLKYAYRTTLWGNYVDDAGRQVEAASWRAWVDAETGEILQLIPQFAFAAVEAKGKGWRLHPSDPVGDDDSPTEMKFKVDDLGSGSICQCPEGPDPGKYCLKLAGVFDQVEFGQTLNYDNGQKYTPTFLCNPTTNFAAGLECADPWDCLCLQGDLKPIRYLAMNAYAHVFAYKQKLDKVLCSTVTEQLLTTTRPACDQGVFQAAKNTASGTTGYVPLRVQLGVDTLAKYDGVPHLALADIDYLFTLDTCTSVPGSFPRPSAQDATVMTHEFAHIVMKGLRPGQADNWCDPQNVECPVAFSSEIVHDMADGLSVVSNLTDSFGVWRGNYMNYPDHEEGGRTRKFDPLLDHFPEHRGWNDPIDYVTKGYADGQIAAAALWAIADRMNTWDRELGRAAFETALLNALSDHFFQNACEAAQQGDVWDYPDDCDIDVYRYLHFLLDQLIKNDEAGGVTVTSNKLTAGFAKVGIFLVPPRCIGASTVANPPSGDGDSYCPQADPAYGGDAVIDITDDWLSNGSGATALQVPEFEVWTGPRFRFDGTRAEVVQAPESPETTPPVPPCNRYYKISIANNPEFLHGGADLRMDTAWLPLTDTYKCYELWSPATDPQWNQWMPFWEELAETSSAVYYRVVTGNSESGVVVGRSSSEYPGKPNWGAEDQRVGPPFARLNGTGEQ